MPPEKRLIDPLLLRLLRCPACADRPLLAAEAGEAGLVCPSCGRTYPVKNGVPYFFKRKPI